METKICSKCRIEKSKSDFYGDYRRKDRLQSQCKKCMYIAQRERVKRQGGKKQYKVSVIKMVCSKCKIEKPASDFYIGKECKCGLRAECKECMRKREKSPSVLRYRASGRAKTNRRKATIKKHGITVEDYDKMAKNQNYKCAICGGVSWEGRLLSIDHDHKTEKVRGLICAVCNVGLGNFQDSADILQKAQEYLLQYKE